jgi:hypothetical protein
MKFLTWSCITSSLFVIKEFEVVTEAEEGEEEGEEEKKEAGEE